MQTKQIVLMNLVRGDNDPRPLFHRLCQEHINGCECRVRAEAALQDRSNHQKAGFMLLFGLSNTRFHMNRDIKILETSRELFHNT